MIRLILLVLALAHSGHFSDTRKVLKSELMNFTNKGKTVRVWGEGSNVLSLPSDYKFLYGPVVDLVGQAEIARTEVGSEERWTTSFSLSLDSRRLYESVLARVQDVYPEIQEMNVQLAPIRKVTVTVPGLFERFQDTAFESPALSCSSTSFCLDITQPTWQITVKIASPSAARASEVAAFLQSASIHYEIILSTKLWAVRPSDETDMEPLVGQISFPKQFEERLRTLEQAYDSFSKEVLKRLEVLEKRTGKSLDGEEGWQKFCTGTHCSYYLLVKEKTNWAAAEKHCRGLSSSLVSIHSEEEQNYVKSLTPRLKSVWIGLKRTEKTNEFKWTDGTEVTYTNWYQKKAGEERLSDSLQTQPDGSGNCVDLSHAVGKYNGEWNDITCGYSTYFVCKKPAP